MNKSAKLGKIIIWDAFECTGESKNLNSDSCEFGVEHTLTIIEAGKNCNDYYHFSSNLIGNTINQEYLRNLNLLKLFIIHFNETINNSETF